MVVVVAGVAGIERTDVVDAGIVEVDVVDESVVGTTVVRGVVEVDVGSIGRRVVDVDDVVVVDDVVDVETWWWSTKRWM